MASMVTISDQAKAFADDLVRQGHYASLDEAIEAGVHRLRADGEGDDAKLSADDLAAIEEGLADIAAGRSQGADDVFDRLTAKYGAMADRR